MTKRVAVCVVKGRESRDDPFLSFSRTCASRSTRTQDFKCIHQPQFDDVAICIQTVLYRRGKEQPKIEGCTSAGSHVVTARVMITAIFVL